MEIIMIALITTVLELGLIYSLVAIGMFLTGTIIKRDDFSIEGSFAVGGALTAYLLTHGIHPLLSIGVTLAGGIIVGLITGLLHTQLGMNSIISGIVVTSGLFSCNLALIGSHATLTSNSTIFGTYNHLIIIGMIAITITLCMRRLLKTEIGLLLRAVGCNPRLLIAEEKNPVTYQLLGFALANCCAALAGSLLVQHTGFYSSMGSVGTLIIALSSMMIGSAIYRSSLLAAVTGSLIYQLIIVLTIELCIPPVWNKLITAVMIIILLAMKQPRRN